MSLGFGLMLAFQVVLAVFLVVIILLQQGKGATAGASFGAGASSTVFAVQPPVCIFPLPKAGKDIG